MSVSSKSSAIGRRFAPTGLPRGREVTLTLIALLLFAAFSIFAEHFFTLSNVYDMARASTFVVIVAVAVTFVFIAGEIDLSPGSLFALCSVMMGIYIVNLGLNPWVAALLTVVTGALMGSVSGTVVAYVGVPSFIVTLGMYSLLRGLALVISGSQPIFYDNVDNAFLNVFNGTIDGFPVQILWGVVVVVILAFVLRYTVFGSHVYATGGNVLSAKAAGINTRRIKLVCFVLGGAACGLIAVLQGALLVQSDPTTGNGFELQVIAAIILGGVGLTGGSGSIYGTVVGAAIIGMLDNGLVLLGVGANWNKVCVGAIIVGVGALEIVLSKRRRRRKSPDPRGGSPVDVTTTPVARTTGEVGAPI
jgi:ribose transport system permease protein